MRPATIAAIWLGGALLAAAAYAVGPDAFVDRAWDSLVAARWWLADLVANLTAIGFDLLRALAIGLFGAFVVLALLAISRGLRARTALLAVSFVYAVAIMPGAAETSRDGWLMAFLLALTGAASMTMRLLRADRSASNRA